MELRWTKEFERNRRLSARLFIIERFVKRSNRICDVIINAYFYKETRAYCGKVALRRDAQMTFRNSKTCSQRWRFPARIDLPPINFAG